MIKKAFNDQILLKYLVYFSFFSHLISINFHPTNFEGGYGQFSNLFNTDNKIFYLKSYYFSQFNTYIFSALASVLNFLIPSINGFQSVKILSASGYFFLGFGLFNILKYYKYKFSIILFILIIFLNSIIWSYGFRAFNDLFAFSLGIFAFAGILVNLKNKIIFFYSLLLGISISIKSYNLILIIPLSIFFYNSFLIFKRKEINKILLIFILIFLPIILLNIFTYLSLGFILAPSNEDLVIAIFSDNKSRNIFWVLNNFIFYMGYLTLICLPFICISFFSLIKKKLKNNLVFLAIFFCISFYLEKFFFISSELDLGPLQNFFPNNIYKTLIIFLFLFFLLFIFNFLKYKKLNLRQLKICKTIIFTIIIYLFILSFIKASQRYLILPLPFIFLIIFNTKQPKIIISISIIFYVMVNIILLGNYYLVSKSTEQIFKYLKSNNILENTIPNVMTPHIYHLYNFHISDNKSIKINSSDYIINYYDKNSIFSSNIKILGYEVKKFSVIKLDQ